jgi:hypothetical protein
VQEFIRGPKLEIHCGWDNIDVAIFLDILQRIWWGRMRGSLSKILKLIGATAGMKITSQRFRMEGNPRNLYKLLSSCQDSQPSDPRDKIYALIPLADDITKDGIQIDYSLSRFEQKLQVVLHYLAQKKTAFMGCLESLSPSRSDGMFTW